MTGVCVCVCVCVCLCACVPVCACVHVSVCACTCPLPFADKYPSGVNPPFFSLSVSSNSGADSGSHWIADSHATGPAEPEQAVELDSGAKVQVTVHPPSPRASRRGSLDGAAKAAGATRVPLQAPGGPLLQAPGNPHGALRPIGKEHQFQGRWLYVKKVVERVTTVAVDGCV
jgi:hypothetical protein